MPRSLSFPARRAHWRPAFYFNTRPRTHRQVADVTGRSAGVVNTTVQTLRPGVPYASNATFHIHSVADLGKLFTS